MLMPDRTNHLKDLILELTRARVRFIVAGGVAMVLHGIERMTVDLDIMLDFEPENVDRFLVCASRLGLTPRAPVSADILRDREKITELVEGKNALVFPIGSSMFSFLPNSTIPALQVSPGRWRWTVKQSKSSARKPCLNSNSASRSRGKKTCLILKL
jgi:hypothetical protein